MKIDQHLALARQLSKILDNQFQVGKFRFGIDPLLGMIPGIGDFLPAMVASYIVWLAIRLEVAKTTVLQMIGYVLIDLLIGMVPVIGDLADFTYKASSKNLSLLEAALDLQHPEKVIGSSDEKSGIDNT